MGRRWRSREEESETEGRSWVGDAVIISSSDDEEANEDLSLAVVAKARLREAKRRRTKDDEKYRAFFIDLSTSSADEIEAVPNRKSAGGRDGFVAKAEEVVKKKKSRPKKKKKKEVEEVIVTEQPDAPAEEEKPAGISDSVIEVGNETSNNLVLRKLLRGPRYFDPGHGNWETCYNCGEEGHIAANCKEEKRQKPCFVCGMFGHSAKHCMQGQDCFVCKRRGHLAKECPDKHKNNSEESVICLRCGDLGHDMAFCRKDYAYSDIKEIRCYICRKYGHLCCVDYKDNGPIEISCYNCAEFGHTGQGCAKQQRCESTAVTPPTLCYRCGQEGHFARGCTKILKSAKRLGESSTPVSRFKAKKVAKVSKSLPRDFGREQKKKSSFFEKSMKPVKSKIKGGWIVDDDTGYLNPKRRHKAKDWASPTTPSGRADKFRSASSGRGYSGYSGRGYSGYSGYSSFSSPRTPQQRYNCYIGNAVSRGSSGGYHQDFSVSRYGYSHGFYG